MLYKQFQVSGQIVRDFCKEQGIREARFYFSVRKFKESVVSTLEQSDNFILISQSTVDFHVMLKLNIYNKMEKCRDSCDKHESLHLVD